MGEYLWGYLNCERSSHEGRKEDDELSVETISSPHAEGYVFEEGEMK